MYAGLAKIAGYHWCEIKLSCFFHSATGCNKSSFLLGRGKRWVNFSAVTGYFVKMKSLPEKPPTDCTSERFITVVYGRTSKHLYKHILKAAYQGLCVRVSTRTGEMITKSSKL